MNRRGLFKLLGAALVLPFLPKKKDSGFFLPKGVKCLPWDPNAPVPWRCRTGTFTWNTNEVMTVHWESAHIPGGGTSEFKILKDWREKKFFIEFDQACGRLDDKLWQPPA